ncbi:MAG: preprotein translocase subunit SecE [Kiritimatiellae bacterium]|nr:preprotein translocase subunit SecE [Kiritimatiellia bacterium]
MSKVADAVKSFGEFLRECGAEIRKISWPNRQQLVGSVWVVGSLILLLSLYVFVCDTVLGRTMTWLVKLGE